MAVKSSFGVKTNTLPALSATKKDSTENLSALISSFLVFDEKFNQAILYYAQVEENLKNDVLAHEASLKLAKANFYKKDFEWTLQPSTHRLGRHCVHSPLFYEIGGRV